jgi:quercetin dioxygenase-like cupin family protein
MSDEPVVVNERERAWETWRADQLAQRGDATWKTLISGGTTPTSALTLGVARLPPGGVLREHRHAQPEVYLVLEGAGTVTISGTSSPLRPGDAVFIPGDAPHAVACSGAGDLRVAYALAADSFEDVTYDFGA